MNKKPKQKRTETQYGRGTPNLTFLSNIIGDRYRQGTKHQFYKPGEGMMGG
ncbi:MAG: hypothetical protein JST63_07840 [Bacteroidetes bacterium]|nr:hypothetical protein [Bacteroidota bacterium]